MQYYWTYSGCDESQEADIAEAWRSRQAELESKAELVGGDERTPVMLTVERTDTPPRWSIQATLYAPEGTASTESRSNELPEALDQAIGELSQQVDEQADRPLMVTERRRGLAAFIPFLESFHRKGMSREFMSMLTPVLGSLHDYIRRELRTRRTMGDIPAGQTTPQDVMDDVLLKAWERFGNRPKQQALDVWLIAMIEESLTALAEPIAEQSLDERQSVEEVDRRDSYRESEKFESVEQATESDSVALVRLIAERPDVEPWDRLDIEAKQARLDQLLRRLPREQRHVLMLQAVEGFTQNEIADLQNRSPKQVEDDLTAAKQEVRQMFTETDYAEIEEKLTREALARPRRSHRS